MPTHPHCSKRPTRRHSPHRSKRGRAQVAGNITQTWKRTMHDTTAILVQAGGGNAGRGLVVPCARHAVRGFGNAGATSDRIQPVAATRALKSHQPLPHAAACGLRSRQPLPHAAAHGSKSNRPLPRAAADGSRSNRPLPHAATHCLRSNRQFPHAEIGGFIRIQAIPHPKYPVFFQKNQFAGPRQAISPHFSIKRHQS